MTYRNMSGQSRRETLCDGGKTCTIAPSSTRLAAGTWASDRGISSLLCTAAWVAAGKTVLTCKCSNAWCQTDGCTHRFMNRAHLCLSNQTKEVRRGQSCRERSRKTARQSCWQSDGWAGTSGIQNPAFPFINMFNCTWTCLKTLFLLHIFKCMLTSKSN